MDGVVMHSILFWRDVLYVNMHHTPMETSYIILVQRSPQSVGMHVV